MFVFFYIHAPCGAFRDVPSVCPSFRFPAPRSASRAGAGTDSLGTIPALSVGCISSSCSANGFRQKQRPRNTSLRCCLLVCFPCSLGYFDIHRPACLAGGSAPVAPPPQAYADSRNILCRNAENTPTVRRLAINGYVTNLCHYHSPLGNVTVTFVVLDFAHWLSMRNSVSNPFCCAFSRSILSCKSRHALLSL